MSMRTTSQDSTQFRATRWSLATLGDAGVDASARSLAELCEGYRYPAYALVRGRGHAPSTAAGLVARFFASRMLASGVTELRDAGSFRDALRDRLERFLDAYQPPASADAASVDDSSADGAEPLEARLRAHGLLGRTPREAFLRAFGLQVIDRVRTRLGTEAAASQRLDLFQALEAFLVVDPAPGELPELARQHGLGPLALQLAIRRLRQHFRELIDLELAETVTSSSQLQAERAVLLGALAGSP